MTENMKKFLEKVTKQEELGKKADQARTKEEITELAKRVGVTLTEEDFVKEDGKELAEEELAAAAGGRGFCLLAGGSTGGCGCFIVGIFGDGDLICVGAGMDADEWAKDEDA